jgi:hypothetical protein
MTTPTNITSIAPYFSPRGRKIAIVIGAIIGVYIIYKLTKKVVKEKGHLTEVQEAYNELDRLNNNPATTQKMSTFQAEQYANIIFTAVNGWETDESAIYKVFYRLKNNADFLAISKAFGIRKISSGYLNPEPDYRATLTEALTIDLSADEKKKVNDILIKKKIKFRI